MSTSPSSGARERASNARGAHPLRLSPSLLACDFARLADEIARAEAAGADWLHVDVMDGHFVPNLTIGPPVIERIRKVARVPLDVHLMIEEPLRYAADYAKAGAHVLTFHAEVVSAEQSAAALARAFRAAGVPLVGVSVNPATPIEIVEPWLELVDLVLVMSVVPGFGGQSFMPQTLEKTRWLRAHGYAGHVEMDGGLNQETAPLCAAAGADVLVAGSALFGAPDLREAADRMRARSESARSGSASGGLRSAGA
jgi:ribulose-phosphate 3-epimerase